MRQGMIKLAAPLAAALALGVGGVAYASTGHSSAHPRPAASEPLSVADTDNIQSGDQTTPDTGAGGGVDAVRGGGSQASDSTGDPGAGNGSSETPNNDGPSGHADEPGNANADHQFQGTE